MKIQFKTSQTVYIIILDVLDVKILQKLQFYLEEEIQQLQNSF
jgi:hypothetical protein